MTRTSTNEEIQQVAPNRYWQALDLLFSHLAPDARARQVTELLGRQQRDPRALEGLHAVCHGDKFVAILWAQILPGRIGFVWPVWLADSEPPQTAIALHQYGVEYLRDHVALAQSALDDPQSPAASLLEAAGYQHAADLCYLLCTSRHFPPVRPDSDLTFEAFRESERDRLVNLIDDTYRGSLDCPQLDGLREVADVIDGYRQVGTSGTGDWYFVRERDRDCGCLLLANHADQQQYELVYMGLIPEVRGGGKGLAVTRFAQWISQCRGSQRLVLAVDANNGPACRIYDQLGFTAWCRQSIFLRPIAASSSGLQARRFAE